MKILLITPYLPHPRAGHGGGTLIFDLLQQLSRHHEVSLLSFCDEQEALLVQDLKALPIDLMIVRRRRGKQKNLLLNILLASLRLVQLLHSIAVWQPYYVSKYWSIQMVSMIRRLTSRKRFDIVQIEYAQMGQYARYVRSGKTILREIDVVFRPAYRLYRRTRPPLQKAMAFLEWCRWARYEPTLARRCDHIITLTAQDAGLLQRLAHAKNICHVAAGMDVPHEVNAYSVREKQSLLFVGSFRHRPNIDAAEWLAEEIFPAVVERQRDTILYIVGAPPPPRLQEVAKRVPGLKVLGFVDDIVPYLRKCAVFVAPLRFGGGVKVKVLTAMANGIPVVTTRVGIEGIDGLDSDNVLIGNSTDKFVEHICLLLTDHGLASKMARKAHDNMRKNYSWESTMAQWEELYQRVGGN